MKCIDFASFHDSRLLKIELENKAAELTFKLTDETCAVVRLNGLDRMLCDSFREGNIVLEAALVNEPSRAINFLNKLFGFTEEQGRSEHADLEKVQEKLRSHELVVFHVAPSYGCDLIALCTSV